MNGLNDSTKDNKVSKKIKDDHISLESLHLWYGAILAKYNSFDTANSSLESKVGVIFAASIAIIAFLADSLISDKQLNILQSIGTIGMVVTAALCLHAMRLRTGGTPTHTTQEMPGYYHKTDEDFIWQQIADLEDAVIKEAQVNNTKAGLYSWIVYIFAISGVSLALSQILTVTVIVGLR